MENLEKGCVYFFRHIGLTPIKIGYSENESPIKRFEQFKTYAPFGAELIGFIRTTRAKQLETELHQKYSRDRIKGEWFEITKDEAEKCIRFYSNLEDLEELNNFQISWARKVDLKKININNFENVFSLFEIEGFELKFLNQTEISEILNIDKSLIKDFLNKNNMKIKAYRVNGIIKKCYKIYQKI